MGIARLQKTSQILLKGLDARMVFDYVAELFFFFLSIYTSLDVTCGVK